MIDIDDTLDCGCLLCAGDPTIASSPGHAPTARRASRGKKRTEHPLG